MIPKTIHYCWFGRNEKPLIVKKCINSWRRKMPDFNIKCWSEDNFNIHSNSFIREAYEQKKWAFVADYVRFYALYNEGGIYLDTDLLIKKSLSPFLDNSFFSGTETHYSPKNGDVNINPEAAIFGSISGHPLLWKFMEYYENNHFVLEDGSLNMTVCQEVMGRVMKKEYQYQHKNENQILQDGIKVFSTRYFCNLSHPPKKNIYAIHQFANSWTSNKRGLFFKFCQNYGFMHQYKMIENLIDKIRK